jgi:hypothetical protein
MEKQELDELVLETSQTPQMQEAVSRWRVAMTSLSHMRKCKLIRVRWPSENLSEPPPYTDT